ncbi:MAG: hypothetical protein A3F26_00450 [Candidatus Ryanbacteria bacterium RIFCSPHIGHO2_12_FULL_47_12b]|uniref:Uncharacterized protein n=2 Tax=Candidatus Ryaniibacteriota TaxID=1817914 RepID=A0A1G2H5M9_9BACT|nr:MAG: hypothetical protein UX74_C0009G0036 [Parcubacteria group bacterium GW2011_GWA2_47_10b]OGZ49106.1 MAG: hypothetical protein A3C83_02070 [Candidatus Ryanbacteria bacterium RIFCSPHIGHO2_02_FULL_47_25]OGZ53303.1 MAG: hypothetical protein A3F26_00450 [Candidatus Ryanbacteria bacterium RIFCSPHIGHO2_12_FULL_47_12b]OGZ54897.1 MAG: hypothetical protein A3J04_02360 [Candidatus Ryanbacteria bacterium RIFCSPLOWO2_02_FULL_47_14]OGZ57777.1 MAG: hypothetical protein A3G60_00595 [Candidatus Ryanbacter
MKYTPEIYARAVREAIDEAPVGERDKVFKRFVQAVARKGDARKLPAVVRELERSDVHAKGGRMVTIEFARTLGHETSEFKSFLKPEDHLENRVNPDLVAGVRITIDEERELDFSLARRLNKMFR